jgi:hypothetical protein
MQRRSLAGRNEVLECGKGAVRLLAAHLEYQFYAQRVVARPPLIRSLEHRLCHAASS